LYVKENLDLNRIEIRLLKYPFTDTTNNIWDYLNLINIETIIPNSDELEKSGNFITVYQIERILFKAINQIFTNTHRGFGNIILCGKEFKEAINNVNINNFRKNLDIKIIESSEIPSKEAIITRVGCSNSDFPFFYYENGDGNIEYKNHPYFQKYVVRLKLL